MKIRMKRKFNIRTAAIASAAMLLLISGCGSVSEDDLVPPEEPHYDAVNPVVVEVERGDLSPKFEVKIEQQDYWKTKYRFSLAEYTELVETYKLEVEDVSVNVGDTVSEGDVMVSFHSEILDDKIRENQKKKREASLEIDHLNVLSGINPSHDYTYDIEKLKREMDAAELHISDVRTTYKRLSLVAEKDGVVTNVNSMIQSGYIKPETDIITVESGSGIYTSPKLSNYEFKKGEKYNCITEASVYQFEVINTPEDGDKNLVYFKPVGENVHLVEKEQKLQIDLPVRKNVCYVNKNAIVKVDELAYVYVLKDNGMYDVKEVKIGEEVDGYIIINEGLEGGEQVALQ